LENALRPVVVNRDLPESTHEEVIRKNEIRNVMKKFFTDRDCHVLKRPINDERILRTINTLPYETLRPEFRG
jgi:Guanylate-binding protein, N-terminal domain